MLPSQSHQSYPHQEVNNNFEAAIAHFTFNFVSHLQGVLEDAGYGFGERQTHHQIFLRFMHSTLIELTRERYRHKTVSNDEIVKEERETYKTLISLKASSRENEPKMDDAKTLIGKLLPKCVKDSMTRSGYDISETEKSHESYSSFVSGLIIVETKKLVRFKSRLKSSSPSRLLISQDTVDQSNSFLEQQLEYILNYISSITAQHKSLKLIASTKKHEIYCVNIKSKDIVLKVLKSKTTPMVKDVKNLENELGVGKKIRHHALRSALSAASFESRQALLLEWAKGHPIDATKHFNVNEFLTVAREIVSSLLGMHANHIMHLNLTCDHVIFNPESRAIKIIGCGSSTSFNSKKGCVTDQELFEKDLHYISPEQTGRINRNIDYRSDFYSLGVIFYKLLTGKFPFESKNALELLQLHICQDPLPVSTINHNIPVSLSEMISKLTEKNADDRYQSTKGIMHDLDLMNSEYKNDEKLDSIELAQHDISETLLIPQKLYGYLPYYNSLLSVFDRVTNSFEVVFISGDSGTGKSSLVFELYRPVTEKNGIIISGKYDFSKTEPYSALLEAVNNFCDDLLLRDESTINRFKSRIQNAIGDEGKILTDVIANLHLILGNQPCASDAFGRNAKNRFIYVFTRFISAMCSMGFPIVLVLDDLQWMDIDSSGLLSALVTDKSIRNLMVVGIYRQNEVSDTHLVSCLLQHIEKAKRNLTQIKIDNLVHESVNELISDTLCAPSHESYALTALIHDKTKGNPFFVKRMLNSLSEQALIFFCNDTCRWKWDASILGVTNVYKNVKELLRLKFLSFDEHTQQVLKVASCLGNSFSLRTLKLIVNRNDGIEGAISTGMITQYKGSGILYHFVHDHIQEAASSLLPKDPKAISLYMGKKLWKLFSKQELHDNIFVVVHLLKNGVDIAQDLEERSQIAELFMEAGKKAIASTAFSKAFGYLESAIHLLGQDCWTTHYSLSLDFHDVAAKMAYCTSNYARMSALQEQIFKNATSTLDAVQSYSLTIRQFIDKRMFEDAINAGIGILNMLGEKITDNRCQSITDSEFVRIRCVISETSDEKMLQMKEMEDEVVLSIMMILNVIIDPSGYVNLQLCTSISLRIVQLTLKHGISKKYSSKGFCEFGVTLCSQGDKVGYKLGKLALTLLKNAQVKENSPMIYVRFYAMIAPFYTSIHTTLDPFLKAYRISLEIGSHESSLICCNTYCLYSLLSGKRLVKLLEDVNELMSVQPIKTKIFLCIFQAIHNLLNDNEISGLVKGKYFNSMSCFDENETGFDMSKVSVISCSIAYLFHNYTLTLSFLDICRRHVKYIHGSYLYPLFLFYDSLVSLHMARVNVDKQNWMIGIQENIRTLKHISQNAPENYANKIHLIEAEMALVFDNEPEAISHYQKAIVLSSKHCFPHEEGLACERAGMYLWGAGVFDIASKLILQAYKCYEIWGAKSKMHHLADKYPSLSHTFKNSSKVDPTDLQVASQSQASVSLLSDYTHSVTSGNSAASPEQKRVKYS